jgi:hypothetical protein
MFSEVGLKEPPPPAIDMLAVLVGLQAGVGLGDGLGLGEGLVPGDGLGLGDALGLGEGLGLGLCASVTLAPTLRKITPMATTAHWTQSDCFRCRGREARRGSVAWS